YFDRLVDDVFFEGYDRVVFCGADSCGYAAAAFSVVSPGATVITMSPQATLDPSVAQWDDRFLHKRRTCFTDRYGYAPDMLEAAAHAFVIYDPEVEPDAMHAALFHGSNISRIRFRHLGGQVDTFLNRMELLAPLVSRAMAGRLTVADFYAAYRERRNYLPYLRMFLGAVQQAERPFLSAMLCTSVLSRMNVPRFRQQLNASTKELQAAGKALPRAVALQSA
ncbi:MAG: phosphoadenosine phosphosulfate reductase, partial [Paracoccaceae bacterium]